MAEHLHEAHEAEGERGRGGWGWFFVWLAVAVAVGLLVKTFVATPYVVPTGSMRDTIVEGDTLLGERVSLYFGDPEAGDIVTFDSPLDGETLIKRVIAVGGQTVDLVDGSVYVDGERLDEPYTEGKPSYSLCGHRVPLRGARGLRVGDGGQQDRLQGLPLLWRGERG